MALTAAKHPFLWKREVEGGDACSASPGDRADGGGPVINGLLPMDLTK